MKKIILLSLIVTALTAFAQTTTQTVAIDEFRYQLTLTADNGNVSSAVATVLGFSNQGVADASIPASVEHEGQTYTVQAVASEAFKGNNIITSLTIPASVSNLNDFTLVDNCPNLTAIYVASGNSSFSSYNGALCNTAGTELYRIPEGVTSYTFNSKLKTLHNKAAYQSHLTEAMLPYGLETIGNNAFSSSAILQQLVIPSSVTSFGNGLFTGCSSLEHLYINVMTAPQIVVAEMFADVDTTNLNLHIPTDREFYYDIAGWAGFKSINDDNVPAYDIVLSNGGHVSITTNRAELLLNDLFDGRAMLVRRYWDSGLSSFEIPDYVSVNSKKYAIAAIDKHTFENCANLTSVLLNVHLDEIKAEALKNTSLSGTLALPYGLHTIGANAFENTPLYRLVLPAPVGFGTAYEPLHVDFLNGLTSLKDLVINARTELMLGNKPWNISSLPADCRILVPLTYVDQYKAHSIWGTRSNYIQPGAYDFVTSSSYPKRTPQANYDDDSGFYHAVVTSTQPVVYNSASYKGTCRYVYHPSIAQNTKSNIRSIEVDRTCGGTKQLLVTELGDSCFAGGQFSSVNFNTQLKKIGHHSFYNSKISGHITMPSSVFSIGKDAFTGCTELNSLRFADRTLPFTEQIFGANALKFEFIVPLDRINEYYDMMSSWENYDNSPKAPRDHLVPYFSCDQPTRMFSTIVPVDFSKAVLNGACIATAYNESTGNLILEHVDRIPANTGVLLTGLNDYREYTLHQPDEVPAAPSVNFFVPVASDSVDIFLQDDSFYWSVADNHFVRPTASHVIPATYAYLRVTTNNDTIEAKPYMRGDVNADGNVDGIDLNILVSIILGHDDAANYDGRADVDEDGYVDAIDLNDVINIILDH